MRADMATKTAAETEIALQRMVTIYVVTGLLFLVLPGTFLGVWNLVSISGRHSLGRPFPGLVAGPRARSDLRLDRHVRDWDRLLFALENGWFDARCGESRLDRLGTMDRRRHNAMGSQRHRISLAYSVTGIGGFPVDWVRGFLRDCESPQSAAGPNKAGSYRDMDEAGHRGDGRIHAGSGAESGRNR